LIETVNKLGAGTMLFTARGEARSANSKTWRHPKEIAKSGCIAIHHGGSSDIFWRLGQLNKVREFCKMVRDTGVLVAITSHRLEVFMEIESQDWDVDYYMTCMYKYGRTPAEWEKSFAANPGMAPAELYHSREGTSEHYGGETAFTRGDPAEMLKVVKQTKKPCWVYKILASGRLCEKPEFE
jgi:kynureninase